MDQSDAIPGFYAPVHRSLTEPILLGGAPRAVAIVNGTLAAAVGLGLRLSATSPPSGPQSAIPPSSMWCAATSATRNTCWPEAPHDEPRRVPPP
jgi:hypothetical protein